MGITDFFLPKLLYTNLANLVTFAERNLVKKAEIELNTYPFLSYAF